LTTKPQGPPNTQRLVTGRAGPPTGLGMLAAVDYDLLAISNSLQLSRLALAKASQEGAARDEAYMHELRKNQKKNEEILQLHNVIESVRKALLEANAMNGDLYNQAFNLKSMLDRLEQVCSADHDESQLTRVCAAEYKSSPRPIFRRAEKREGKDDAGAPEGSRGR
jgi:hypothetical protein